MPFYNVEVFDEAYYPCIKADTPEQAERIAEEWFYERHPATRAKEFKPSCEKCYHFQNVGSLDSVSACNCCEDFSFFEPN